MNKLFALALALLTLGGCASAPFLGDSLGLNPYWDWKTLRSENFTVNYPEELEEVAQKAVMYLERTHKILTPKMKWKPRQPTEVLIIDNSDLSNGLAAAATRLGMVLWAKPPANTTSISAYDDWLWMLIVHEYTHILNLDPTTGFMEVFRWIYGDTIRPNHLLPRWMLEGLAVYMETFFTQGGRGRSTYYQMILRTSVDQEVLDSPEYITLDKVNGPNPYVPAGETPYFFGYQLHNEIAQDERLLKRESTMDGRGSFEDEIGIFGEASLRSGGRIPFFINNNLKNVTGRDWREYWDTFVERSYKEGQKQLDVIEASPITKVKRLTREGFGVLGSAQSPDGRWIIYSQSSNHFSPALFLRNTKTGETTRLADTFLGTGTSFSFSKDSRYVFYSGVRRNNNYSLKSDLFAFDLRHQEEIRLSEGLRAANPHVHPDGRSLVFEWVKAGRVSLGRASLTTTDGEMVLGEPETLYDPATLNRISHPKFYKGGVIFSFHPTGKAQEDLRFWNPVTKKVTTLLANGRFNFHPTVDASNGQLYYVSDFNGVYNLYQWTGSKGRRLTNLKTGLWLPQVHKGRVVASVYGIDGWDLAQVPTQTVGGKRIPPFTAPQPSKDQVLSSKAAPLQAEDYSPWQSLRPRTWGPSFLWYARGGIFLGGQVTGSDAVSNHLYNLGAGFDFAVGEPDVSLLYANRSLGPTVALLGAMGTLSRSLNGLDLEGYTRTYQGGISVSFPIQFTWSVLTPSIGASFDKELEYEVGKSEPVDESNYIPTGNLGLTFSNARGTLLGISGEEGFMVDTRYSVFMGPPVRRHKVLIQGTSFHRIMDHTVLVPNVSLLVSSHRASVLGLNAVATGSRPSLFANGRSDLPATLSAIPMRGYPGRTVVTRFVGQASGEVRFPLMRIFRGFGTNPLFLKNVYGFGFGELTTFPHNDVVDDYLPSMGAGFRLTTDWFLSVPVAFSAEYHQGLDSTLGGQGELYFSILIGSN